MEQTGAVAEDTQAAVDAQTVCEAFQRTVAAHPDRVALRTKEDELSLTWAELDQRVRSLAAGFAALGIGRGDTVAMLLPNVPECHMVDYASLHLGAVPFTIYASSSPEQIQHQLDNADARVLVTQEAFLPAVHEARPGLPALEHVVAVDGDGGTTTLEAVEAGASADFDFDATWRGVEADDIVTLIYTSGTTGPPKGVQWAHRTVMAQLRALRAAAIPLPTEDVISFLPMAHAGGRLTSHYMALAGGATITTCPDMKQLGAYLGEVRPDALFTVPRVWEKLRTGIEAMVEGLPDEQRAGAKAVIERGLERVRAGEAPARDGLETLQPILARLGLDRLKAAFVGGAPSPADLSQFFRAVGVPLLEGYGLTEGSLTVFNRIDDFKLGTAGKALPGVELRLADDGEVLLRGELNMVGYRKDPEKTAAALDGDGWLHTGDIGRLDDDGFLSIVDRKKELIINASGKNMSPANIESAIKAESSLIGQVVAIGDRRPYNTALITLDPEAAPTYAKRLGIQADGFDALAASPELRAEVEAAVERGNKRLSGAEQVKKFELLPDVWLPDGDELTPTMKLKRKPIAAKYQREVDALYAD